MSLAQIASERLPSRVYQEQKSNSWLSIASVCRCATDGRALRRWAFRFGQSGSSHIAQALRGDDLHIFGRSSLRQQALVPFAFQVQVSCSPRSQCPELRPPVVAIRSVRTTAHTRTAHGSISLSTRRGLCRDATRSATRRYSGHTSPDLSSVSMSLHELPPFPTGRSLADIPGTMMAPTLVWTIGGQHP